MKQLPFKKLTGTLLLILCCVMCMSTDECTNNNNTARQEQAKTEENQSRLLKVQPPMQLDWSLEREQINKRTGLWNDKNKVAWIYLISYGRIMAYFTIKGKVSSVNSQITNPEQLVYQSTTLPSPAEDGSYGTNGDAVYFFTTDGAYVEWNQGYMLSDKPLKLTAQPLLYREMPKKKSK